MPPEPAASAPPTPAAPAPAATPLAPEEEAAEREAAPASRPRRTALPQPTTSTEFTSIDEAEAALEQAHEELARLTAEAPRGAAKQRAPAAGEATSSGRTAGDEAKATAASPCQATCRAFESLKRAALAVCRLAGDASPRCTRAQRLVVESERRVEGCGCASKP